MLKWDCQRSKLTWTFTSDKAMKALQNIPVYVFSPQKSQGCWRTMRNRVERFEGSKLRFYTDYRCDVETLMQVSMIRATFPKSPHFSHQHSTRSSECCNDRTEPSILRLLFQQLRKSKETNANHFRVLGFMNISGLLSVWQVTNFFVTSAVQQYQRVWLV